MPSPRLAAIAGVAAYAVLVAVQHPLRGDLPADEHFVSEYAKGSTAAVQIVAFACWSIAMAACAVLAARARPDGRRIARTLATGAFAVAAAGAVLTAIFATQTIAGELPPDTPRTDAGRLHDVGSLMIFAGLLLASPASLRLVRGRSYRLTIAVLAAVLFLTVPVLVALGLEAPGIGQRMFIAAGCVFLWRFAREVRP